jgi:hypothetical protein
MNRSDIIKQVNTLTENRASKLLDMNAMFNTRLQKFCQEKRYWWREQVASFTTVASTGTYDLASASYGEMDDLDEIVRVIVVNNAAAGDVTELTPIFDPTTRLVESLKTGTGKPSAFCIEKNTIRTLRLSPIPDGAYTVQVIYWAIPALLVSQSDEEIPLVPDRYHHVLISGLKMDVLEYLFGVESPKYLVAAKEYAEGIAKAESKWSYSVQKVTEFRSREEAVRST